ncbi:hypothetical protein [Bradyrhizobium sp.]|uniref:hypothetical protein n=1 Tax=Bradyrhizobium sp. TaxID=376 RepID=UPI001EBBAAE0|nr:hypothetical protein [Bradyrhizobium sp.]MBV9984500.1 hypothetical protein [Bradyrhizobium sp.]
MTVNQAAISVQVQAALAAVQAAIASVGDIGVATPFELQPVVAAVSAETAVLLSAISSFDVDIITNSVAGMVAGLPAPTLASTLVGQQSDSAQLATLLNALGYLQRLSTNLALASG